MSGLDPVELWFRNVKAKLPLENQNRLTVFVGKTGSGKSWATVSTAERIFPEFDPAKHIAYFDPWVFLDIVRKSHKGDVVIFDEAGVGMDNREWMTKSNKIMTKITQTFRTKNLFVFFTAPSFGFIDIKLRVLFHDFVRMDGVNFKGGFSHGQWKELKVNVETGELQFWPLTLPIDGRQIDVSMIKFAAPKPETTQIYETLRKEAADRLFANADDILSGSDRAVTIEQASKMLQLQNSNILYSLIREGLVPVYRESSNLKVGVGWIRKMADELKLRSPNTVVSARPIEDVEKGGWRHVSVGAPFVLVPWDEENIRKYLDAPAEMNAPPSDKKDTNKERPPEGFDEDKP